jgi:hypothetical protein
MIIRPHLKTHFVALPNSLFNDRRLSADTRAMLALLLSKPPGWHLRPVPLMKLLSREGEPEIGWTRFRRMLAEAIAAGYIVRSDKQLHNEDGTWGRYDYIVGMPQDVLDAARRSGMAIAPRARDPHEGLPHAQNEFTNHKVKSPSKTDSKNEHHHLPLLPTLAPTRKSPSTNGSKPVPPARLPGKEVIQHQIALLIGGGDAAKGWAILEKLPPSRLDELTARQRLGRLTELELSRAVAELELAEARGQSR